MAEGDDSAQEKTHEATPRRIEQAREQGDLPRSQDAQSFAAYAGLALAMGIAGPWSVERLGEAIMAPIAQPARMAAEILEPRGTNETLGWLGWEIGIATAPLLAAPAVLILAILIASRGIVLAPDKAAPKLSRVSLLENARQKFGPQGLVEFAKSALKLAAIATLLILAVLAEIDHLAQYASGGPRFLGALMERQFWAMMTGLLIVTAAIGAFDFIWQRLSHLARLRMSHQEVKEESRQAEGDPHMRQVRRSRAREIATNRMMLDVPQADVVIVNPTHYAVALAWDRDRGTAPRCLAKGVDEIALRIRRKAEDHGIPIREDAATARSIHDLVEVGMEISPEHYKAVAAAILFADDLRGKARSPATGAG